VIAEREQELDQQYAINPFVQRVRSFEKRLQANMKNIMCPTHLSLGHEGVAAELHECLRPEDWLFSTHRNHHHYLAKGGDEQKLWDEIHGLESGLNGGFAGSQGISDPSINFHASAILGGLIGVATGTAYAIKGTGAVVVCCLGDAGTEQGVFWESLNFAALHKLPIAFICENNGKSVDAKISERQATPITSRVQAFGINTWTYAGGVEGAVEMARSGVPSFYEAKVTLECDHLNMSSMMPSLGLV
jgi:TPP-dependent pyruvate/acetoin dehydrogenase alpha subunit